MTLFPQVLCFQCHLGFIAQQREGIEFLLTSSCSAPSPPSHPLPQSSLTSGQCAASPWYAVHVSAPLGVDGLYIPINTSCLVPMAQSCAVVSSFQTICAQFFSCLCCYLNQSDLFTLQNFVSPECCKIVDIQPQAFPGLLLSASNRLLWLAFWRQSCLILCSPRWL